MIETIERPRVVLVSRSVVLNSEGKVILLRRNNNPEKYAGGLWEVPGGKLDEGQDIVHTVEAEVMQETGLVVNPLTHLAYFHSEIITDGKYSGLPYVVLVGISRVESGDVDLRHNPDKEHDMFEWVDPDNVLDYNLKPDIRMALTVLLPEIKKLSRQDR